MSRLLPLLMTFLLWVSCIHDGGPHESVLSNSYLKDPGLIHVRITLTPRTNYSEHVLRASIVDNNLDYVQILNGGIRVNNIAMSIVYSGSVPVYSIRSPLILAVEPDADYTFEITLSDSSVYLAQIHTQSKYMSRPMAPDTQDIRNNMRVEWSDLGEQGNLLLQFYTNYKNYEIDVPDAPDGNYTFAASYLNQVVKDSTGSVNFRSVKRGTIDTRFGQNSYIESIFYSPKEYIFFKRP